MAVHRAKVPAIFAFGNFLIEAGADNFIKGSTNLSDFLPYGETSFHKGSGRCTNWRLAFDFFASSRGLPFMPPFLQPGKIFEGVNCGSAGSGIQSTTGLGDGLNPLTTLVSEFYQEPTKLANDSGLAAAGDLISNSVFAPGSNEMSALKNSPLREIVSPIEFVTKVMSQLQVYAETVYSGVARNVVCLGIGPLGCSPEAVAAANAKHGDCEAAPNQLPQAHNEALPQLVDGLNSQLHDLHAVLANPVDTFEGLIINGTADGFAEGSTACCPCGPFCGAVRCGLNGSTNLCGKPGSFLFRDLPPPDSAGVSNHC